ncbi:MAG: hypothetical protein B6U95_04040 [Thermofilum sp. ex4484_82]|nr:MAG: hypothetical protein B6U95_04040 [Thermofilum sp. ex4484_82]OYT38559.1 MAG: hypothetical protein B6U96_04035 [Archaeoglobales archaeon ex4484_92]
MNSNEFKGVMVFSENFEIFLELLGKGRELADKLQTELSAALIGHNIEDERGKELIKHGADKDRCYEKRERTCSKTCNKIKHRMHDRMFKAGY